MIREAMGMSDSDRLGMYRTATKAMNTRPIHVREKPTTRNIARRRRKRHSIYTGVITQGEKEAQALRSGTRC